jgi:glycerol-3-phosphate cytidylyltransferase-like family protein
MNSRTLSPFIESPFKNNCFFASDECDQMAWLPDPSTFIPTPQELDAFQTIPGCHYTPEAQDTFPSDSLSSYEPEELAPKVRKVAASKKIAKSNLSKDGDSSPSSGKMSKRQLWTPKEDAQVVELVKEFGTKWAVVASYMNNRTGKQVRDRYTNYLQPNIKTDVWTEDEDQLLINLYFELGKKWSMIANKIPGRTENQVKSRFYTHLKKHVEGRSAPKKAEFEKKTQITVAQTSTIQKRSIPEPVVPKELRAQSNFSQQKIAEKAAANTNKSLIENLCKIDPEILKMLGDDQDCDESPAHKGDLLKSRKFALESVLARTVAEINQLESEIQMESNFSVFLDL